MTIITGNMIGPVSSPVRIGGADTGTHRELPYHDDISKDRHIRDEILKALEEKEEKEEKEPNKEKEEDKNPRNPDGLWTV